MLNEVKEWLIKFLGGYTEKENDVFKGECEISIRELEEKCEFSVRKVKDEFVGIHENIVEGIIKRTYSGEDENEWKAKILALTLRLLSDVNVIDYKKIDQKALQEWAYMSFDSVGWKSYLAYEDLRILKELSFGKDRDQYMVLIGRRLQLLYLADEFRKAVEMKKSNQEKNSVKK